LTTPRWNPNENAPRAATRTAGRTFATSAEPSRGVAGPGGGAAFSRSTTDVVESSASASASFSAPPVVALARTTRFVTPGARIATTRAAATGAKDAAEDVATTTARGRARAGSALRSVGTREARARKTRTDDDDDDGDDGDDDGDGLVRAVMPLMSVAPALMDDARAVVTERRRRRRVCGGRVASGAALPANSNGPFARRRASGAADRDRDR
jgi:hypothetical protein